MKAILLLFDIKNSLCATKAFILPLKIVFFIEQEKGAVKQRKNLSHARGI